MSATGAVVVIGGSAGAIDVLLGVLPQLTASHAPVIIVVHRLPTTSALAHVLGHRARVAVSEPVTGDPIARDHVYVAPPDHHLSVTDDHFVVRQDAPVRFSRPSIDVLLASASATFGQRLVAVVLTGSNLDGVDGACEVHRHHGYVIVQDPADALAPQLPAAVIERGCADEVVPVHALARHIADACARVGRAPISSAEAS